MTKKLRLNEADLVAIACWELSDEQIELFFKVMKNHGLILLREADLQERKKNTEVEVILPNGKKKIRSYITIEELLKE